MADQHQGVSKSAASGGGGTAQSAGADKPATPDGVASDPTPGSGWLPAVVPMRARAADDDIVIDEWPAPGRGLPPRSAAPGGWMRWLRDRAAIIAVAAAAGGVVGAAAATGIGQVVGARGGGPEAEEAVDALRTGIGQLASEIKALRDDVDEGSRAALKGLAALEGRVARAESGQAELTAQIAGLTRGPAQEPVAAAVPLSPEITGSIAAGNLPVASDWVLWRVRNGRALVQGSGGYFEVVPGSQLPGLGLVQRIIKQGGRWIVLTQKGAIVARG